MDNTAPQNVFWWCLLSTLAISGALLSLALTVLSVTQAAHAQKTEPEADPEGNCFDGTLAQDPTHCRAFETAYAEGMLDVEAI